jgi:membrane associated rhomboid family serine protease
MVFGWLIKLILESFGVSLSELPHPIHIAWQAHIAGIMIGVAIYYGSKQNVLKHNHIEPKLMRDIG